MPLDKCIYAIIYPVNYLDCTRKLCNLNCDEFVMTIISGLA